MERIAATAIFTQVINFHITFPTGYGFDKPRIDEARDNAVQPLPLESPITTLVGSGGPLPAVIGNSDLREESNQIFCGKMFYGKISDSHKSKRPFDFGKAVRDVSRIPAACFILAQ